MFTGIEKILLKLITKFAVILSKSLYDAISNRLLLGIFLDNADNAKVASVSPINKGSDDKNKISIYIPVSILKCFSKIEQIKMQLLRFLYFLERQFLLSDVAIESPTIRKMY